MSSYTVSVLNSLIVALRTGNSDRIIDIRATAMAWLGHNEYTRLYNEAYSIVYKQGYMISDNSPKVISESDDNSYVGNEITPSHNED
jgi:hypothetical protein